MEEKRFDNSTVFTNCATFENMKNALGNPMNKTILLHKPGSVIKTKDGKFYRIDKNGTRRKIDDDEIIKALEGGE